MVEQVVAELSSFRKAASQANEYVSQLFGGLLPSASKTNEASKELSATAKASSRNDDRIRTESNKAAAAASETADLGKQILSELKDFSKNFTSLISGGDNSLIGNILGFGVGGASLAFASIGGDNIGETDINQNTPVNASYSNPETGFESVEINGINFAPGAIASPNSEGAHTETKRYATRQNIDTTVNMFSQIQGQFGGSLTVNDFIPKVGTERTPPSEGGGSMHWYGKAMDISTSDMNDKDKLRLVEAALTSGFKGFGFGNGILHVDWGNSRAWGYRNGKHTSDLKGLEYGGLSVTDLASWVTGGQKPEEVVSALENSPLSEPTSEPPPSAAEDEMAANTIEKPQAQETDNITQVARNDIATNDLQTEEIIQASFSNPTTPGTPENSIAMADDTLTGGAGDDIFAYLAAGDGVEKDNSNLEKPTLRSVSVVDLPSSDINYKTASSVDSLITPSFPVSKSQYPKISPVSLAIDNARVETVNFEKTKLELASVDLTPVTQSQGQPARLSGANISRPVVTPAASYIAPQESSVASVGLPNTKTPEPLDVIFDTNWIAVANGTKRETNKTWVA